MKMLRSARREKGLTMKELGAIVGVSESAISQYENGKREADFETLLKIGEALGCSIDYLLRGTDQNLAGQVEPEYPGACRLTSMHQTPLLGRIACGEPILAEENIEDYVDLPKHITADFALECRGDSMIGAGIQDGDVVYIRQQPEVENGQIAAVLVGDDEATLKRFYFDGTTVQLVAENPKFAPMVFTGEDINKVRVIGRAVAFTHSLV